MTKEEIENANKFDDSTVFEFSDSEVLFFFFF